MAAPRWAGPTGWAPDIALVVEFENCFHCLALLTGFWVVTLELEAGLTIVTPELSHHYGCASASIPQNSKTRCQQHTAGLHIAISSLSGVVAVVASHASTLGRRRNGVHLAPPHVLEHAPSIEKLPTQSTAERDQ